MDKIAPLLREGRAGMTDERERSVRRTGRTTPDAVEERSRGPSSTESPGCASC